MVDVIEELKKGTEMYAIFAPAMQGQFDNATLPQVMEGIRPVSYTHLHFS